MLKRYGRLVSTLVLTADLLLTIGTFLGTYGLFQARVLPHMFGPLAEFDQYLWLLLMVVPVWAVLLKLCGVYQSHRTDSLLREVGQILRAMALGGVAFFAFVAASKSSLISRPFIVVFVGLNGAALIAFRVGFRSLVHRVRARGLNYRTVLIVGTGPTARLQAQRIARNPQWGLRVLGFVSEHADSPGSDVPSLPILGAARDIRRLLSEYIIDEVVVAVSAETLPRLENLFLECEEVGVRTRLSLDFFPHRIARIELDDLDESPMLTFTTTPPEDGALLVKRAMDIVGSLLFLVSFSWLYALITTLIKLTSRGPVFYRQARVGLHGRHFTLYKFRSMVQDADQRRQELAHLNDLKGPHFKLRHDPRVTGVGRFLRKFSLDEIPQMWNVLKGDMSLVGPRPPLPYEVEKYDPWARRRLSVRPGLTCLWQVGGRHDISYEKWMELDLAYIDNWSLGLDFKILLKTLPAVLGGRGAW